VSARKRSFFRPKSSLRSLRLAFFSLGVVLLGGITALFLFMQERLTEARLEREQMVASRVFDELEREVSAFLDGESDRERYGALRETDPRSWAPFVIGYFKYEDTSPEVVTAGGPPGEDHRRVVWALEQTQLRMGAHTSLGSRETKPGVGGATKGTATDERRQNPAERKSVETKRFELAPADPEATSVENPRQVPKRSTSGSEIIQQLNRAQERRKAPAKTSPTAQEKEADQFLDYTESY
jgi:hypothetical protein